MTTIIHEREKCIGCGACAALCSEYWEMADDGKSLLKGANKNPETGNNELEIQDLGCNGNIEESCPALCIHIK
ncbi:ferredoxin [Candidatus Kuenenbacteria bacterium HGW-Kuenenbacteria-1]|uniref:Ferredoxin n=1 Tax=Candidatus Kuenenbacteria bacterium HGW-Kuenenbacteria-1 TaxID=2013812 RepID=A0A2N1UP73_9BACT|nr:MAG: ferredoxin [Candidatus Kuenenbacteria bacterium HGW-Kuenenbacteria-1]